MAVKNKLLIFSLVILLLLAVFVAARTSVDLTQEPGFTPTAHFVVQNDNFGTLEYSRETLKPNGFMGHISIEINSEEDQSIRNLYRTSECTSTFDNHGQISVYANPVLGKENKITLQRLDLMKDLDGQTLHVNGRDVTKSTVGGTPLIGNSVFSSGISSVPSRVLSTLTYATTMGYDCQMAGESTYSYRAEVQRSDHYVCKKDYTRYYYDDAGDFQIEYTEVEIDLGTILSDEVVVGKYNIPCASDGLGTIEVPIEVVPPTENDD